MSPNPMLRTVLHACLIGGCVVAVTAHSNLITPKPRNAIDSRLPGWENGTAPYSWQPYGDPPCGCTNGTSACESAQTCLWFSVGCSIGCDTCDGGAANPGYYDRCPHINPDKKKATVNDPLHRTINRDAPAGSDADWTRFNPWRAPGSAPVYDPCGRASGGPHESGGKGEYTNTSYAHVGMMGSTLPKFPSGAVWKTGSVVETMWSLRANHGGGYQYRLCPLDSELTEACMQQTPVPFAGNSKLMLGNGTMMTLNSTFVTDGTLPVGGTWQMNPLPGYVEYDGHGGWKCCKRWFDPPCDDPQSLHPPQQLSQGLCSGEWLTKVTTYDYLRIPEHLKAGEYVLGFRWDCEASAQIWQSCADVTIV